MKQIKKTVLLWHSPREMYTLVTAVEDYPQFLPWCERAEVLEQHTGGMTARLHLSYAGVRHAFTTRNVHQDGSSVELALVDGPFSVLEGLWKFLPLARPGEDVAQACKIEFEMRYAFSNRPLEVVLSPVFDRIADTFVDAFVERAQTVYGQR